jgi:hypothetical protein
LVLLFLLFCGYLLVAFCSELATTLALPHLGVSGHRQCSDYRSDRKGSHFDIPQEKERTQLTLKLWQIRRLRLPTWRSPPRVE